MLFENLPGPARRALETMVGLSDGENPVVAFFESDNSWCLLTNYRVVWHDLSSQYDVGIMDLCRVSHDMHVSVQRDELDRSLWRDLNIETTDGRKLSLRMEPGKPFIGLWSALHWLCGWAEKRRQTGVAA